MQFYTAIWPESVGQSVLQSLTALTLKCRATGNDYGVTIEAGNENNNEDLKWAN